MTSSRGRPLPGPDLWHPDNIFNTEGHRHYKTTGTPQAHPPRTSRLEPWGPQRTQAQCFRTGPRVCSGTRRPSHSRDPQVLPCGLTPAHASVSGQVVVAQGSPDLRASGCLNDHGQLGLSSTHRWDHHLELNAPDGRQDPWSLRHQGTAGTCPTLSILGASPRLVFLAGDRAVTQH